MIFPVVYGRDTWTHSWDNKDWMAFWARCFAMKWRSNKGIEKIPLLRSFRVLRLTKYFFRIEMGCTCGTYDREKKRVQGFGSESWGRQLGRAGGRWQDEMKTSLEEIRWKLMNWIYVTQGRLGLIWALVYLGLYVSGGGLYTHIFIGYILMNYISRFRSQCTVNHPLSDVIASQYCAKK